jgi:hypothetical protein
MIDLLLHFVLVATGPIGGPTVTKIEQS